MLVIKSSILSADLRILMAYFKLINDELKIQTAVQEVFAERNLHKIPNSALLSFRNTMLIILTITLTANQSADFFHSHYSSKII